MTAAVIGFLVGVNLVLFGPGIIHYWRHRTDPLSGRWLWLILLIVLITAVVESV